MFIRKDIRKKIVDKYCVPYCKECKSQNVKIIKTCVDCGSHDIATCTLSSLDDFDEKYGTKIDYKEEEFMVHSCDYCGKEFDKLKTENRLYDNGGFIANYDTSDYGYVDPILTFSKDICPSCITKVIDTINEELDDIVTKEHIEKVIKNIL